MTVYYLNNILFPTVAYGREVYLTVLLQLKHVVGLSHGSHDDGGRSSVGDHLRTQSRDAFHVVGKQFGSLMDGDWFVPGYVQGGSPAVGSQLECTSLS